LWDFVEIVDLLSLAPVL